MGVFHCPYISLKLDETFHSGYFPCISPCTLPILRSTDGLNKCGTARRPRCQLPRTKKTFMKILFLL